MSLVASLDCHLVEDGGKALTVDLGEVIIGTTSDINPCLGLNRMYLDELINHHLDPIVT